MLQTTNQYWIDLDSIIPELIIDQHGCSQCSFRGITEDPNRSIHPSLLTIIRFENQGKMLSAETMFFSDETYNVRPPG